MSGHDQLRLNLLGGMKLTTGGQPVTDLVSHKAEALLIYLVMQDKLQPRETVAHLLWGNQSEKRALASLSNHLYSLRKQLDRFLLADSQHIGLNRDADIWVDVLDFAGKITQLKQQSGWQREHLPRLLAAQLEQAVTLYQGSFLQGFKVRQSPAFDEWLFLQRERWQFLAIEAISKMVDFYLARGKYSEGKEQARRLLAMDAFREQAHRQMMQLLASEGDRVGAVRQYEECRQLLETELQVMPDNATVQLMQQIKNGTWQNNTMTTSNIKASVGMTGEMTPLVGRETEIQEIENLLNEPDHRLITLLGAGGIGKSRLGMAICRHLAADFWHGTHFISLAGLEQVQALPGAIADTLGIKLRGTTPPIQQVAYFLQQKEILLILDNFEQLLDGVLMLTRLLEAAPDLSLLITSRERLNLRLEWIYEVSGLPYPLNKAANVSEYDAVKLFTQTAQRAAPAYQFSPERLRQVARICQLVEGLPLGLELAAAWIRELSVAEIADRLAENFASLTAKMRDMPARHHSLQAVFDYSWGLLAQKERVVLAQLSVFRGGFSQDAAVAVTDMTRHDTIQLSDKSLLRRLDEDRYEMHELLRQFAAEKWAALPPSQATDEQMVRHRHAEYYISVLATKETQTIEVDIDNVRRAWVWSLENGNVAQWRQGFAGLHYFYQVRSRFQEAILAFEPLPAKLQDETNRHFLGIALNRLGFHYFRIGRYAESEVVLNDALAILEETDDQQEIANTLNTMGNVALYQGQFQTAQSYYEDSLTLRRLLANDWEIAISLNNLAETDYRLGEYDLAEKRIRECMLLCRQVDDQWGLAVAQGVLGFILLEQGQLNEAEQVLQESLVGCRAFKDPMGEAETLSGLGSVAFRQGELEQAKFQWKIALTISQQIPDPPKIAAILANLGYLYLAQNDIEQAKVRFTQAQGVSATPFALKGVVGLAAAAVREKDWDKAAALVEQAQEQAIMDAQTQVLLAEVVAVMQPMRRGKVCS